MPSRKLRKITAQDLYKFQTISGLRLAPDGRSAVYSVQRVDQKTEKKYANLWMVEIDSGEARQFTWGDQNDVSPCWSPDGRQVAFLSNRGDKEQPPQLYLIPFGGGEARPLSDLPGQIGDFAWSPDGRWLLCSAQKHDPEELERQKDEQKKKLGVVARHYDRLFYKLDGVGYLPRERWHLWLVDAKTGKARQLTGHPVFDEEVMAWSPDGRSIAFLSNHSPDPDATPDQVDLFVMPTGGGDPRRIETPTGPKTNLSFSPDGKWIAYLGSEGEGQWYHNQSLWITPLDGSAPVRNLTGQYDLHLTGMVINDIGQPEDMPPAWSQDGKTIYFQAARHGSSLLMSVSITGENLQTVVPAQEAGQEGGATGSWSFSADQQRLAYFRGTLADPAQVWVQDLAANTRRMLASPNQGLLQGLELGQVETHWIKSPDGYEFQGWILKPPGFDPARKYPSILEIHGGPMTQYGYLFMHEFYYLAAHGYVVHFCNPRGGRGYGEEHTKAIWGSWGDRDYVDLMAWADFVAGQPYIDVDKMGVTGGSYGGYMTVWIIGHTDRFKAAVTQRCVSNFVSFWGSTDFNWIWQDVLGGKPPYQDLEKYWKHSPIAYIGNATTPTKVIHNEGDLRCPIEQSEQVYVALKRQGVPSEMVRFPDEFHGLSRTGRTDRRIARLEHILGWFEKYLQD